jgi:type IV secretion system protein VirD4
MQGNPAVHRLVARVAKRFFGKADREASGVLSAAQRHTHSLDSPRIADCVATSDFRFADLREGAVTIFLCLPPDRIDTYSRWLRLSDGLLVRHRPRYDYHLVALINES